MLCTLSPEIQAHSQIPRSFLDGSLVVPDAVRGLPPLLHRGLAVDLGVLLWGFFDRFGNRFDYNKQAVSVRQGGITSKLKVAVHLF